MVVYNSNPAAIAPNQNVVLHGLRRDDLFTVVLEQFQTDTADYRGHPAARHYVPGTHRSLPRLRALLPANGAACPARARRNKIERRDLPGAGRANGIRGTVLPGHGRRHDLRTLLARGIRSSRESRWSELDREALCPLELSPEPFLPFANGGFGTPSGKCEFGASLLKYEPPIESRLGDVRCGGDIPLEFVSSKNDDSMNSTSGTVRTRIRRRRYSKSIARMHWCEGSSPGIRCACSTTADPSCSPPM